MARIKNIEAFCPYCNSFTKMELSIENEFKTENDKKWAKCKKCKQKVLIDYDIQTKVKKITVNDLETDKVKDYKPGEFFNIGDSIYHKGWDDFGVVVSKEVLADGKSSILVEFQKSGSKKLIETIHNIN
ncbi:MAG: hypothetical protein STSR0008_08130 [Ignavibacterium sp.]